MPTGSSAVTSSHPSVWGDVATWATVVIALLGLGGVWWQIRAGRLAQREATAYAVWTQYLHLAMEHPVMAAGCAESISSTDRERYEWFVSILLFGAEQVLEIVRADKEVVDRLITPSVSERRSSDADLWAATIWAQLRYHHSYLSDLCERDGHRIYTPVLSSMMEKAAVARGP